MRMKMIKPKLERKMAPARKFPVRSVKNPTIKGPEKPPISETQKNTPVADPRYLKATCGVSINVRTKRGKTLVAETPKMTRPAMRGHFQTVTHRIPTPLIMADSPMYLVLYRCGTMGGIVRTAGIPAKTGMAEITPALAGDMPPFSRIFGSHKVYPCIIAKDKRPDIRIIRTLWTLNK